MKSVALIRGSVALAKSEIAALTQRKRAGRRGAKLH